MTTAPVPYSSNESASGAGGFLTQTLAIFHDAYRELNARKMFWVALGLSLLAITAFGLIGVTPTGLKFFSYEQSTEFIPPQTLYKSLFNDLMIGTWLTWAAIILAVISTASIFPDFLTGGSVDLFLSKPISRMRLFLTKYVAGMTFVFLQVAIFAVVAFFVVGIRGHLWEPRLFWMIPIVLCFFSYLFSISVLFGVMMRSTLAALLFTILFWLLVYAVHSSEVWLQATINITQQEIVDINDQLAAKNNPAPAASPSTQSSGKFMRELQNAAKFTGLPRVLPPEQQKLLDERNLDESNLRSIQYWHRLIFPVQVIVPKTTETISLLNNMLLSRDEFENMMDIRRENALDNGRTRHAHHLDLTNEMDQITRSRTMWWVLGSSLCFEAVIISLGGWLFCRRDY